MAMFSDKKERKYLIIVIIVVILFLLLYVIYINQTKKLMVDRYDAGVKRIEDGNYQEGIDILITLGDYKDCIKQIEFAKTSLAYENAVHLFNIHEYKLAAEQFEQLGNFKDSEDRAKDAYELAEKQKLEEEEERRKEEELRQKEEDFRKAYTLYQKGEYVKALELFVGLADYDNSQALAQECKIALKCLTFSNTISAGIRFSAGVTQDGKIFFSGRNFTYEDELYTWDNIISVSVEGNVVMGLKKDGTVVTAGQFVTRDTRYYIDTSEWHDIVAISAGQLYIVGLKKDGTLTAQGHNGDGQADIKGWSNIVAIDTGWRTTVGLDASGNIHITGYGSEKQLRQIAERADEWTGIVAISTGGGSNGGGGGHTVGLRRDGTVVAVGANDNHQLDVDDWENIIAISAGDNHTVGLKSDGTVVTTPIGSGIDEKISTWENIVAISAGYNFTLGLKADGTVVAAGYHTDGQSNVEPWNCIAKREEWQLVFNKNFDFLLDS